MRDINFTSISLNFQAACKPYKRAKNRDRIWSDGEVPSRYWPFQALLGLTAWSNACPLLHFLLRDFLSPSLVALRPNLCPALILRFWTIFTFSAIGNALLSCLNNLWTSWSLWFSLEHYPTTIQLEGPLCLGIFTHNWVWTVFSLSYSQQFSI